ncbi:MAG: response regulator [Bdellovibrio sp.]|nr:response regulator [Bdellovibrio sp.]
MIHVLFVDDEPDLLKLFQAQLTQVTRGEHVVVNAVDSAQKCIDYLADQGVEEMALVISDINMPEMDGLALLKVVQKRFPQVKVYICSGHDTPFHRKNSRDQGAMRFFAKPLNISDLYRAMIEDFPLDLPSA